MKKILYLFLSLFIFFNLNLTNINADYIQTSNPQHSESLAADDILTSDHQNTVIVDIANIIVDIGNLKNYIDGNLGTIWTETSTQIEYNDKDVYFGQNLRVVDTLKVDGNVEIAEGGLKDNTITTTEIINGQIKKEDLDPAIFAELDTLWKLNGNKGYYNAGNVGIGDNSPSEKLVVDGNLKFDTVGKGIIFPDGTIQTTGNMDESNNMKLTGDQVVHGIKTFKKPIQLKNGEKVDTLTGDYFMGENGEYCAAEGETCNVTGTKRIIYGAQGKYVEKIVNGNTACNNSVFGDPAPGLAKTCFIAEVGNDSVASKLAIKSYIDKQLKSGKSVSCNKDINGKKLEVEIEHEINHVDKIVETENIKTNFQWNNETTDGYRHTPSWYSRGIAVDKSNGNDERGRKIESTAMVKHTGNNGDYIYKLISDFEGPVETYDCRGSGFYTRFYQDNDNYIYYGVRNSRQNSRSYNCGGSCNNKNFGSGTNQWSCVSGNNCGAGSWLHLRIEQGGKIWNYIYMLKNLGQGKYKYYNETDFKNKKWKIKVTDLNGNVKYNTTVNLPNPTNGLDLAKLKGNYKLRLHSGKSCSNYNPIYIKTYRLGEIKKEHIVKDEVKFKYPINLSSVESNLCSDGNPTNKYTCVDNKLNDFSCNSGDKKDKPTVSSKWNCNDGTSAVKCGVNFNYVCKPNIKSKVIQETIYKERDKGKIIDDKQLNGNRNSNRYTYTAEYTVPNDVYKIKLSFKYQRSSARGRGVYLLKNNGQIWSSVNNYSSGSYTTNIDVKGGDKIKIKLREYGKSRRRNKVYDIKAIEYYSYKQNKTVYYDANYCDVYEDQLNPKYSVSGNIKDGKGFKIVGCNGQNTTIDNSGNFEFKNIKKGTNCSDIRIETNNGICKITTNGPSSLSNNYSNVAGECVRTTDVKNGKLFAIKLSGNNITRINWYRACKAVKSDARIALMGYNNGHGLSTYYREVTDKNSDNALFSNGACRGNDTSITHTAINDLVPDGSDLFIFGCGNSNNISNNSQHRRESKWRRNGNNWSRSNQGGHRGNDNTTFNRNGTSGKTYILCSYPN